MLVCYRAGIAQRASLNVGLLFGLGINWFLGVLIAIHRKELARYPGVARTAAFWPVAFAAAVAMWASRRVPLEAVYMLSGLAFSLMLLRFLCVDRPVRRESEPRWIAATAKALGLSSFPMYLFHGPVLLFVGAELFRWNVIAGWRVAWAVLVAAGAISGVLLGFFVEAPIMAWRSHLLRRLKEPETGFLPRKRVSGARPSRADNGIHPVGQALPQKPVV
jgi:peptidoglycan/LPS O-acetylase OafA/YrhL